MPELLIMRHAKSAWNTDAPTDFDRPLSPRGERDRVVMAEWIVDADLIPDVVVASSAVRARQTARAVAEICGLDDGAVTFDRRFYGCTSTTWLDLLRRLPDRVSLILICGHNPTIDDVVESLSATDPPRASSGKLMTTAALAHLTFSGSWSNLEPARCSLRALIRPSEL